MIHKYDHDLLGGDNDGRHSADVVDYIDDALPGDDGYNMMIKKIMMIITITVKAWLRSQAKWRRRTLAR